jgi:hypothetical protein
MVKIKIHNTAEIRLASTLKYSFSNFVEVFNLTVANNKDGMYSNLSYLTEPVTMILLFHVLPLSVLCPTLDLFSPDILHDSLCCFFIL